MDYQGNAPRQSTALAASGCLQTNIRNTTRRCGASKPEHRGSRQAGQTIVAASADTEWLSLLREVDRVYGKSSLCAQRSCLGERSGQKIIGQRQLPDLLMQALHVNDGLGWTGYGLGAKHTDSPLQQLVASLLDLIGVDIKLLCQIRKRFLTLDRSQCCHRLEGRGVVLAYSSRHGCSCSQRIMHHCQAENPLIPGVQFSGPHLSKTSRRKIPNIPLCYSLSEGLATHRPASELLQPFCPEQFVALHFSKPATSGSVKMQSDMDPSFLDSNTQNMSDFTKPD